MLERINFNGFILTILIIIFFYSCSNYNKKYYYKKVFLGALLSLCVVTVSRMVSIFLEYREEVPMLWHHVNQIIYFSALILVFAQYAYYTLVITCRVTLWNRRGTRGFFVPAYIGILMCVLSPHTGFVYRVNQSIDGISGNAYILYYSILLFYCLIATICTVQYRRILPNHYYGCTIVILAICISNMIRIAIRQSRDLVIPSLCLCMLLLLIANSDFEKHYHHEVALLNSQAIWVRLSEIFKRKKRDVTMYYMEINEFSRMFKNYEEEDTLRIERVVSDCLRNYIVDNGVFYLEEGKYAIIAGNEKFKEQELLDKLRAVFSKPFSFGAAKVMVSMTIYIFNPAVEFDSMNKLRQYFERKEEDYYFRGEALHVKRSADMELDQLKRQIEVEVALENAIKNQKFEVYYQPIFSSEHNKVISAEALIRLKDEKLGYISPEEFIPIAEKNGMINYIDEYVFDQICKFIRNREFDRHGMEYIEVNMSVMQCLDKDLVDKLVAKVKAYDIQLSKINIEITETALPYEEDLLLKQFKKLRQSGFTLSLDDYGTGYSNMIRVMEYPISIVKFDKAIVWSAFEKETNFTTIKNLIKMFHDRDIKIVAEGIENVHQVKELIGIDCDYLQGYLFSKPCPEKEFLTRVKQINETAYEYKQKA